MDRRKTPPEDVERLSREMKAPEDPTKRRREAEAKSAMRPTSGAAIPQAFAGAQMAAEALRIGDALHVVSFAFERHADSLVPVRGWFHRLASIPGVLQRPV